MLKNNEKKTFITYEQTGGSCRGAGQQRIGNFILMQSNESATNASLSGVSSEFYRH
jgi:hypothetical protein